MTRTFLRSGVGIIVAAFAATAAASAGTISLAWDPAVGATGYRVYYGTTSGSYSSALDVGNSTHAVLQNLQDCTAWFLAVKAYNTVGESPDFSNEVTGWPRPALGTVTPLEAKQGSQLTIDVLGTNFQSDAVINLTTDNPRVIFESEQVVACDHIQVAVSISPGSAGERPAQIGTFPLTIDVMNPDRTYVQSASNSLVVDIDPARFDVNRSDNVTDGRLDGKDTVLLSRSFGGRDGDQVYDPDSDFDGDGWIDGEDLSYLAANLGRCWSGSEWAVAACPEGLR